MPRLDEVARYIRSKNAGPFWVTLDVFCGGEDAFDRLREAPLLSAPSIAALYGVDAAAVRIFHDRALRVIKISYPRPTPQGSVADVDMHAGQAFTILASQPLDGRTA